MGKKQKLNTWEPIKHEQVYLKTRGHTVDIHVYPVMQLLWDSGVQTFFSCQGGPNQLSTASGNRRIKTCRAMVIIHKDDLVVAMKVLMPWNPKKARWDNRYNRDHVSIKFDASHEARAASVDIRAK